MAVSLFAGCGKSSGYQAKQELADSGDVTLTLVGMYAVLAQVVDAASVRQGSGPAAEEPPKQEP